MSERGRVGADLMIGMAVIALLAPLPWLGDLRHALLPYLILTTVATLVLYGGFRLLERRSLEPSRRLVLGVAVVLRLAMLPMQPSLSDDVYRYLWDGRLLLHGVSPYLHVPADSSLAPFHDELFRLQGYPTTNTIYPPGAQLIFAASMAVGEVADGFDAGYIVYKLLLIGAELIGIAFLLALLERLDMPRRRALLYAWHPLAVVELAGQGHTDAFWVLSLAAALYYYHRRARDRGAGWLAFGVATRLFPLVLMPLWGRFMRRREIIIGAVVALPFLLLFLSFITPAVFENYSTVLVRFTNFYEFNGGVYYPVKWGIDRLALAPSNVIAGRITTAAQMIVLLGVWLLPPRDRSFGLLVRRAMLIVSAQVLLLAKVHIWYFTGPLLLLTIAEGSALRRAWLWAALAGPFTYLMYAGEPFRERVDVMAAEWGGFALLVIFDTVRARRLRNSLSPAEQGQAVEETDPISRRQ